MDKEETAFLELMLKVHQEIHIAAPAAVVFESVLEQMGPNAEMPGGQNFSLKLEPWPGGRWYRDLGNNSGHLWGHVQVIKPPTLIEITGPFMMSYPAVNHIQYRLTPDGDGTKLSLSHRAIGDILPDHRNGVVKGWEFILGIIKKRSER
jgi:Activator of Hsp90 ATPase homolog 1-like protein